MSAGQVNGVKGTACCVLAICEDILHCHGTPLGIRGGSTDNQRMGDQRTNLRIFSDTWQLVINTGTTIVTFLMVFLIQNTQNRDSSAIQLKLDELIRSTRGAHNALLDLEELTQDELNNFLKTYQKLAHEGRRQVREGWKDTGTPEVRKF